MKAEIGNRGRKKWDTPNELPKTLQCDSDSEYYSDSFESYSSESNKVNLMNEIMEKLEVVPADQIKQVLDYVKLIAEHK